jgi:hypothetical protein
MQKYKIAVVLRSNKVLYFSQRAYAMKNAVWVISQVADDRWGKDVVSVKCLGYKKGGKAI